MLHPPQRACARMISNPAMSTKRLHALELDRGRSSVRFVVATGLDAGRVIVFEWVGPGNQRMVAPRS